MSTTDNLAIAALIVSALAFLVSFVLGVWEFIKFRQEGARTRVTLRPGVLVDGALMTMGHPSSGHPRRVNPHAGRFGIEVAEIEIENKGRSPITIKDVSLDLGRTNRWRLSRHTVMFPLLKRDGYENATRKRLEGYDNALFLINMNHALWALRRRDPSKPLIVRASARVAGRRAVRSPWRKRWLFGANTPPRIWLDEPFDLAREVYRYLYKTLPESDGLARFFLPQIAMIIAEHIESTETVTRQSIEEVIKGAANAHKIDEPLTTGMWAFNLAEELDKPNGPFDGSYTERRRLARGAPEDPTAQPERPEPASADGTVPGAQ